MIMMIMMVAILMMITVGKILWNDNYKTKYMMIITTLTLYQEDISRVIKLQQNEELPQSHESISRPETR